MSRKSRAILLIALAVAAAVLSFGLSADRADAICQSSGGNGCTPGSGYTFHVDFNCGSFYGGIQHCYEPGNCLGGSCVHRHTFGWGSADYDGANADGLLSTIYAEDTAYGPVFSNADYNFARACWKDNCNDETFYQFYMRTGHNHNHRHTIYGRGKA